MNYYEILGVNTNATHEEIKSAYKKLARKGRLFIHPWVEIPIDVIGWFYPITIIK